MGAKVDNAIANSFGCIVEDATNARVIHFVEKPQGYLSDIVSCGVYLFSKDIFSLFQAAIEARQTAELEQGVESLTPTGTLVGKTNERLQMERYVLPVLAADKSLFVFKISVNDFWMPVKTGSSTIPANRKYLQYFLLAQPRRLSEPVTNYQAKKIVSPIAIKAPQLPTSPGEMTPSSRGYPELIPPVYIHPSAKVDSSAKIGPNVSIGPRVVIDRGVRIRDALILDGVEVAHDACILNAIVGWESKIGSWARIEGSTDQEEIIHEGATSKGYKLPTASILGKNVTVNDEIIIRDCIVLPHKELKYSFQQEILM